MKEYLVYVLAEAAASTTLLTILIAFLNFLSASSFCRPSEASASTSRVFFVFFGASASDSVSIFLVSSLFFDNVSFCGMVEYWLSETTERTKSGSGIFQYSLNNFTIFSGFVELSRRRCYNLSECRLL